jgi:hypothetical protein
VWRAVSKKEEESHKQGNGKIQEKYFHVERVLEVCDDDIIIKL